MSTSSAVATALSTSSALPPITPNLKTKLKTKRQVMKQLRGNQCTFETLQQTETLPPQMKMAVARQVAQGAKNGKAQPVGQVGAQAASKAVPKAAQATKTVAKAAPKKSSKKKKPPSVAQTTSDIVSQSTSDTLEAIRQAKREIFQTTLTHKMEELCPNLGVDEKKLMQSFLKQPEVNALVEKCLETGNLDEATLQKSVQDILNLDKKIFRPRPTFNHGNIGNKSVLPTAPSTSSTSSTPIPIL
jgi:hypothetical protein